VVAVKCIDRNGLPEEDESSLRQEVEILRSLDHPNIVKLLDFFEEEKFFYVVLEFLPGGELFERIVKKSFYNEKEARDVVRTVCLGMKYCHDRGIAHRDLKPENLLLTTANDDAIVKIADFGFAIKGAAKSSLQTQCGTPGYVAPEILNNKPYGKAVDMWSIGVITYILLGGYPPFHDENQKNLFKKIKKGEFEFHEEYWGAVSSDAKDLIRGLLHVDPESRLTVDDVLGHSWVRALAFYCMLL
jgi:calcium/calmodulin-dependent protein kinase I